MGLWSLVFLVVVGVLLPLSSWQSHRYLNAAERPPESLPSTTSLAYQGLIAHAVVAALGMSALAERDLGVTWSSEFSPTALLAAIGVLAVALGAARVESRRPLGARDALRKKLRRGGLSKPWLAAMFAAAFAEEFAYRGVLFLLLCGIMAPLPAACVGALLFGLAHFSQGLRGVLFGTAFALGLQFLCASSGGLLLAVLTHLLYDLSVAWMGRRLEGR